MSEGIGIPQSAFTPKPMEALPVPPVIEPKPIQPVIESSPSEQTNPIPETNPAPEIQSQQKDEKPGLFRTIRNKVQGFVSSFSSSKDSDLYSTADSLSKLQMTRRQFLARTGKVLAGTAAAAAFTPLEQIPHLAAQSEQLFYKGVRSMAFEQDEYWRTFFQEASQYKDHEGPMRFVVPEKFAGKQWNKDELTMINNIVEFSKEVVNEIYGAPAAWTENETTIVTDDVLGYFGHNPNAAAAFLDCDLLTQDIFQRKELLQGTNLLLLPRTLVEKLRDDTLSDAEFSFRTKQISHEIDHANNQYHFPTIVLEGLAEMTAAIAHRKLDPEMAQHLEQKHRQNTADLNSDTSLLEKKFDEIITANPLRGESLYNAAGHLMTSWHDTNPEFFKSLRQKENELYKHSGQLPTFAEWKELGESVKPGFKSWIESQRVLSIRD